MKRTAVVIVVMFSVGALSGCKRLVRRLVNKANSSTPAETAEQAPPEDPEAAKLQPYIKCLNDFSGRIAQGRERYLDSVDPATGPTGKERHISHPFPLVHDPKQCADGVAAAASQAPRLPELEAAGSELAAVIVRLGPLLKTVDTYYTQGDHKDDNLAKGKELHTKLMAEWAAFGKADHAVRGQVKVLNRKAKERRLAALEKNEGRKLSYLAQYALYQAEPVVDMGDVAELKDLPLDNYMALVGTAEKAIMELDTYADAHKDEAQKISRFSSLVSQSKDFLAAAKELARRVRDKKPYYETEKMSLQGGTIAGSPQKLVAKYNTFVETANRVL
jgi:hypothetical protein